jgi:hypothetical protein
MHHDRVSSVVTRPFDGREDVRLDDDGTGNPASPVSRVSRPVGRASGTTRLAPEPGFGTFLPVLRDVSTYD